MSIMLWVNVSIYDSGGKELKHLSDYNGAKT